MLLYLVELCEGGGEGSWVKVKHVQEITIHPLGTMGAAASVEGFQALSAEQQEEMKAKYVHLIAEGKTEEDAVSVLKADCDHKTSSIEE